MTTNTQPVYCKVGATPATIAPIYLALARICCYVPH